MGVEGRGRVGVGGLVDPMEATPLAPLTMDPQVPQDPQDPHSRDGMDTEQGRADLDPTMDM